MKRDKYHESFLKRVETKIQEGKAILSVFQDTKISKKLEVFYNPVMKFNRDMSVAVLNALPNTQMQVADIMAASGVRSIRFLKELKKNKIASITMNDFSKKAVQYIKKNLKKNNLQKDKRIILKNKEANLLLLESKGFDYIDIDPFGTPIPFLDAACKRISRDGILAVTATDTSALAGAFPAACRRKYSAIPLHGPIMHEIGLRILIMKCQSIAAQYDKALLPVFSYSRDHYMRVFFHCLKGKSKADDIVKQHSMYGAAGPIWLGQLWDAALLKNMKSDDAFFKIIKEEAEIDTVGFYDIHALCKKNHIMIPKHHAVMDAIRKKGYAVARTHFSDTGLRTAMKEEELLKIIKILS
jgi:tRNA (guanine26-N2/guanine27-N2)-dimethyltransferase